MDERFAEIAVAMVGEGRALTLEALAREEGRTFPELPLEEQEALWEAA